MQIELPRATIRPQPHPPLSVEKGMPVWALIGMGIRFMINLNRFLAQGDMPHGIVANV